MLELVLIGVVYAIPGFLFFVFCLVDYMVYNHKLKIRQEKEKEKFQKDTENHFNNTLVAINNKTYSLKELKEKNIAEEILTK